MSRNNPPPKRSRLAQNPTFPRPATTWETDGDTAVLPDAELMVPEEEDSAQQEKEKDTSSAKSTETVAVRRDLSTGGLISAAEGEGRKVDGEGDKRRSAGGGKSMLDVPGPGLMGKGKGSAPPGMRALVTLERSERRLYYAPPRTAAEEEERRLLPEGQGLMRRWLLDQMNYEVCYIVLCCFVCPVYCGLWRVMVMVMADFSFIRTLLTWLERYILGWMESERKLPVQRDWKWNARGTLMGSVGVIMWKGQSVKESMSRKGF